MTNYLVNNCLNTVKHQASASSDKARRQISYLLVRQRIVPGRLPETYITRQYAYGPWYGNGTEAILHIKSHCSAPIFFKVFYFKVKLLILTLTLKYNCCIMPL